MKLTFRLFSPQSCNKRYKFHNELSLDFLTIILHKNMCSLARPKSFLPEECKFFPLGIHQLHRVIHQVSGKNIKIFLTRGVNNPK